MGNILFSEKADSREADNLNYQLLRKVEEKRLGSMQAGFDEAIFKIKFNFYFHDILCLANY